MRNKSPNKQKSFLASETLALILIISGTSQASQFDLAKLFDCADLLTNTAGTTKTNAQDRAEAPLEDEPTSNIIFRERDLMTDIVFVATNDDFYKLESIVRDENGSNVSIRGYLYKRDETYEPKEIDLFKLLDESAAKSNLVNKSADFKSYVKVADLLSAEEVEIKIKLENFAPQKTAAFIKTIKEKLED